MDPRTKQWLLDLAEIADSGRLYPRFVIMPFVGVFIWQVTFALLHWYMHEPAAARGTQETALVTGWLALIVPLITLVINIFGKTGRNWDAPFVNPPIANPAGQSPP